MEKDNDIDQLFRNGLSEPDIPFNEFDWEKMEQKLDAKPRKRIPAFWIFQAAGLVAAMLLIVLWFFSKPADAVKTLKNNSLVIGNPGKSSNPDTAQKAILKRLPGVEPENQVQLKEMIPPIAVLQEFRAPISSPTAVILAENHTANTLTAHTTVNDTPVKPKLSQAALPEATDSAAVLARKANALAMSRDPLQPKRSTASISAAELSKRIRKNMDAALSPDHHLVLSAMAAPDVSTAKASKSSKLSTNIGMLATYALGKKISVTSGAIYARKFYNSEGSTASSYGSATNTWEVYADCNVLDVPVNVNYKLIAGKKITLSLSTGLSSYFMLKEKYDYVSDLADGSQKVSTLEISNQNKHLLGIANLGISVDHQITDRLSVGVQPFAKLPLTGIGYGNASLKSAGVSFSLNIGLFPAKKPGKYAMLR